MPGIARGKGNSNVFVEGKAVYCEHDVYHADHSCIIVKGSSTIYVNGKGVARIGDSLSCGAIVEDGSKTVFAG